MMWFRLSDARQAIFCRAIWCLVNIETDGCFTASFAWKEIGFTPVAICCLSTIRLRLPKM